MKTGAESAEVADELVSTLLESGGITFGGIGQGDGALQVKERPSPVRRSRCVNST